MPSSIQYEATLEVLRRKAMEQIEINDRLKKEMDHLEGSLQSEKADVDQLENESFLSNFLKVLNLHEELLLKEKESYLRIKLLHENKAFEFEESKRQLFRLQRKIMDTETEFSSYRDTLLEKTKDLEQSGIDSPQRQAYSLLTTTEKQLKTICVEVEEALEACQKVMDTRVVTLEILDSAESWSVWDTWVGGGLITDMIKYDKIEVVQNKLRDLSIDLNRLEKELADIGTAAEIEIITIEATTKFFDIWFDNFFSDIKVRNQLKDQREALVTLGHKLEDLRSTLQNRYQATVKKLEACSAEIEMLIMKKDDK